METLNVELGERSYPIHIGAGLLGQPELISPYLAGKRALIVTNETVAPLYLAAVQASLPEADTLILADGEQYKTLETLNRIYTALLEQRHDRRTTLIALGGGVIGDITGYAAASYQRGVAFIQIPTTLLSQVDSSVGGKTGVNHSLGKNMIGAFWQPQAVLADTSTLNTLAERELSAGLAEVIKYGLLGNLEFLAWIEANLAALRARDPEVLAYAIKQSCADKAAIVAADEREAGQRALLNLGHTFGHAIETVQGYGVWLHGEAVGAGMVLAAELSARLGWLSPAEVERVRRLIDSAGLPVAPPAGMTPTDFLEKMAVDKKVIDGQLRLVLLKSLGQAVVTADVPADVLKTMLEDSCNVS